MNRWSATIHHLKATSSDSVFLNLSTLLLLLSSYSSSLTWLWLSSWLSKRCVRRGRPHPEACWFSILGVSYHPPTRIKTTCCLDLVSIVSGVADWSFISHHQRRSKTTIFRVKNPRIVFTNWAIASQSHSPWQFYRVNIWWQYLVSTNTSDNHPSAPVFSCQSKLFFLWWKIRVNSPLKSLPPLQLKQPLSIVFNGWISLTHHMLQVSHRLNSMHLLIACLAASAIHPTCTPPSPDPLQCRCTLGNFIPLLLCSC